MNFTELQDVLDAAENGSPGVLHTVLAEVKQAQERALDAPVTGLPALRAKARLLMNLGTMQLILKAAIQKHRGSP